jgi:NADPH-dependent 2,4-dienoyl-CoA reductase/sulfur reductase-like enzyme/rhodanese-related sulfurtransferase
MTSITKKRLVVIGGSAAGPKAASRARRLDETSEIILLQKEPDLSMASCGYPYYVGGGFSDRNMLISNSLGVTRDPAYYARYKNITARTGIEVTAIDREKHTLSCRDVKSGNTETIAYDKLVIATGATPRMPSATGMDLEGVTAMHSMADTDYLKKVCDEKRVKKAVIVGGGLVGVETCEALYAAGMEITIVEAMPQILGFMDWEMARLVENYIRSKKVNVITGNPISMFQGESGKLESVRLKDGTIIPCELAVVAIGVTPNAGLAREAGLRVGTTGGIIVNEFMQTSDVDIYAAGDCVESRNVITGRNIHAPFGDQANLQGRVAGENAMLGNLARYQGVVQTGICKIFDYTAGSTGLSEAKAREIGYEIETVINANLDKPFFMDGKMIITKLVVEKFTERILGVQCFGSGEVSRQLSIWSMGAKNGLTNIDMVNADLPYAPPYSLAIDHSIVTAHIMQNKLRGFLKGMSSVELKARIDEGMTPFCIDVRTPAEHDRYRLGVGEKLIPLEEIRDRIAELPQDKKAEIVIFCRISLRAYEAARILKLNGYRNAKILEGGLSAWPYDLERQ